jgi:hypothetical protein
MEDFQVTPEEVCKLMQPKDELAEGILMYEAKYLAH